MATHTQRKHFRNVRLAAEAAAGFRKFDTGIPGAKVLAEVREIEGDWWVYVSQIGDLVRGDEPILPDISG
jgi:hypothetical protein